jgi:hypothetical protein
MKINNLMRHVWIAVLCCAACLPVHAQSATDGAIGGTVEDITSMTVPNATITIRSNTTNAEQTTTSDAAGFFRLVHLPASTYTVRISAAGFQTYESKEVIVQVGLLTELSPKLAVGSNTTVIEVTSEAPALNTVSPDFANVIPQRILQDLPVSNYRWSAYAALTPGVIVDSSGFGLLSFRGQSTLMNNVTIDGADDNQAYFSEERGRTRAG